MVTNTHPLCGWQPNPAGVNRWLRDPSNKYPKFKYAYGVQQGKIQLEAKSSTRRATVLYPALFEMMPDWVRGRQGIGDCVSWGWELAATHMLARMAWLKQIPWRAPAATEPIYGGSRVEARGRTSGGWSDGSYGGAAAKWVTENGIILREDYSGQTGSPDDDLRQYDSRKAKQWGNYGCGGSDDKGRLDAIAKEFPVKTTSMVQTAEEAADAIELFKCPIPVCSNYGFSSTRNKDGFVRRQGSWSHCMCLTGVRFDIPGFLLTNSWGHSWDGPMWPKNCPDEFAKCSAWISWQDAEGILRQRDSYAISPVLGFDPAPEFDGLFGLN